MSPGARLVPEIVVGRTVGSLVFASTASNAEVVLEGWGERLLGGTPDACLAEAISVLGAEEAQLLGALRDAGFLATETSALPSVLITPTRWAIPLATAVSDPGLIPAGPCIIHRRSEALLLPRGLEDPDALECLRLFTSGLRPVHLRRCYAHGASSSTVAVTGDVADVSILHAVRPLLSGIDRPAVVRLPDGIPVAVGDGPGRLHPAQSIVRESIRLGDRVLHRCGAAMVCPDLRFCDLDPDPWAWGHSFDPELARHKAIAEAVERYATSTTPYRDLVFAPARDLGGAWLDPNRILSYTRAQLDRHPDLKAFRSDEPRFWVGGEDAAGQPIHVLADLVFNPFVPPLGEDGRVHCRANSSGTAYGPDAATAKLRAVLECLERDAFMRVWLARWAPPQLTTASTGPLVRDLVASLEAGGWRVVLPVIADRPAVIAAVVTNGAALIIGCAAGDPEEAAVKALAEASVALTGLAARRELLPNDVRTPEDHAQIYRNPDILSHAAFITSSDARVALSDLRGMDAVQLPVDACYVRLPRVVGTHHHVWRCLAPGLIPMMFGYDMEPRGRADVASMVAASAARSRALFWRGDELLPHPFA